MRPRTGFAAFLTVLSAAGVQPRQRRPPAPPRRRHATTLPPQESFRTVVPAGYDQVVRGVSVTPGTR